MRDLIVCALLGSSGVWFSLGFAYADFGMLKLSVLFAVLTAVFLVCEFIYNRSKSVPQVEVKWVEVKLQAVRHGDEFFIKNLETGTLRPSSRDEVSELWNKGQIIIK